jgi:hypothetical protein
VRPLSTGAGANASPSGSPHPSTARFGVEAVYLTGGIQAGRAGPESDVDLQVVFRGTSDQRRELELWLEGWSLCLAEVARETVGARPIGGLLDVQFVERRPPAAALARELPLGGSLGE